MEHRKCLEDDCPIRYDHFKRFHVKFRNGTETKKHRENQDLYGYLSLIHLVSAPKWYAALAIEIRARCPPESATPRLPMGTLSPAGNIFKSFSRDAA
jgi:hypothetical protein